MSNRILVVVCYDNQFCLERDYPDKRRFLGVVTNPIELHQLWTKHKKIPWKKIVNRHNTRKGSLSFNEAMSHLGAYRDGNKWFWRNPKNKYTSEPVLVFTEGLI